MTDLLALSENKAIHGMRADIYRRRVEVESSLMAKGHFRTRRARIRTTFIPQIRVDGWCNTSSAS